MTPLGKLPASTLSCTHSRAIFSSSRKAPPMVYWSTRLSSRRTLPWPSRDSVIPRALARSSIFSASIRAISGSAFVSAGGSTALSEKVRFITWGVGNMKAIFS